MIFVYPVIFNSIIECLMISKFSPQAGALSSPSIYIYNANDVFVQVRKGDSIAWLVNLEIRGRVLVEDRGAEAKTVEPVL